MEKFLGPKTRLFPLTQKCNALDSQTDKPKSQASRTPTFLFYITILETGVYIKTLYKNNSLVGTQFCCTLNQAIRSIIITINMNHHITLGFCCILVTPSHHNYCTEKSLVPKGFTKNLNLRGPACMVNS